MNRFDSLKRTAFDVVTHTMGYDAEWTSSESGGLLLKARVGYKDPSEKQELSGIESWDPSEPFMEFRIDFFPGLKQRVDSNFAEFVYIYESSDPVSPVLKGYFAVKQVRTSVDGDTYVARLIKTAAPVII